MRTHSRSDICGERNHERFNCDPLASSAHSRRQWSQQMQLISASFGQTTGLRLDSRNGIMYILSTGCQWRAIPKDLPPRSTLFDYLDLWSYDGTLDRIHHALYVACREQGEREASPTAAIVDSQSVKSAEKGGAASIRMAMTRAKRSRARSAIFS